jgi:hypothetical protein
MVRLRQSYLGSSPQRTLFIVPRPPRPPPPSGECYISSLPDELLAQILDHLAPPTRFYHQSEYENCLGIPTVCERWRRLYEPILYRRIDLGYSGWQKPRRTARLVKTFEERPGMPGHVRDLDVQIYKPSDATCRLVTSVVLCCRSIRKLSLHMPMSPTIWPIIHASSKIPRLERLGLSGIGDGPALQMILAHFGTHPLTELKLNRYGLSVDDGPSAPWRSGSQSTYPNLDHTFSNHFYNGAVSTLILSDPSAPPYITKRFLQWPAHLTRLSLTFLIHSIYATQYSLGAMQELLNTQCESLQHVTIGIIPCAPNGIPNFSHFLRLQTLELNRVNLFSEKPRVAAAKLSAPLLRHLGVNFCTEDQHHVNIDSFATEQVRWLEELVSYVGVKSTASSKLDTVFVEFTPETPYYTADELEHMIWPWEPLEQAVKALSRYGVTMTYSTPECPKQDWSRVIARIRTEHAALTDPESNRFGYPITSRA